MDDLNYMQKSSYISGIYQQTLPFGYLGITSTSMVWNCLWFIYECIIFFLIHPVYHHMCMALHWIFARLHNCIPPIKQFSSYMSKPVNPELIQNIIIQYNRPCHSHTPCSTPPFILNKSLSVILRSDGWSRLYIYVTQYNKRYVYFWQNWDFCIF